MAIEFNEIFEDALCLINDPDILKEHDQDPVKYQMDMRPLLIEGSHEFTSPTAIVTKLRHYSKATGKSETYEVPEDGMIETDIIEFDGESKTYTYKLATSLPEGHEDATAFSVVVDGVSVNGTYDKDRKAVVFPHERLKGKSRVDVSWYYAGAFTSDFTHFGYRRGDYDEEAIGDQVKHILAKSIAVAWSLQEQNRVLDIRNLLSDADLSFYSPANSIKAKIDWHKELQREMDGLIVKQGWNIYATPVGGSSFGK